MSRSVAVLRPEPGNSRTAAAVEAMGLDAIRLPLFTVFPVAWSPPEPDAYDAIVATSANAFRHGGAELAALTALPVLAVGAATAAAARAAGFAVTATGERDAASLVAEAHGRLLHLAGREHRPVAGAATRIVYATGTTTVDAARLATLAGQIVLIHSPRAAARLAELVPPVARATIRLATLSAAVSAAAGEGWARVEHAPAPRDDLLLAIAGAMATDDGARVADRSAASVPIDRAAFGGDNRGR